MIINTNKYKFKIYKNSNNKFWKNWGLYHNFAEVFINDKWWKTSLEFKRDQNRKIVQIYSPMQVDNQTNIITEFLVNGMFDEIEVNSIKYFTLKFLLNKHPLNSTLYNLKRDIFVRKYTIFVFTLAFLLSTVFYYYNINRGNTLINFIANNIWAQTIVFFITISGFINIFHPFTIKKELTKKEMENIAEEIYKKREERKEFLEKRKNRYR